MAKNEQAAPKQTPVANGAEEFKLIPLSEIHIDSDWNSRHKSWLLASETPGADSKEKPGEETHDHLGFAGFMASIANDGQDTPVIVRPTPDYAKKLTKKPYMLVVGYRRCEAIEQISQKGGSPHVDPKFPTVKALVRTLTEEQAKNLNLRENVDRENLSPADIAWGVWRVNKEHKATQAAIATELGMSQSYVNKLLQVMTNLDERVAKAWREGNSSIPVNDMTKIAQRPKAEQVEAFKTLAGTGKTEKSTKSTAWKKKAIADAGRLGAILAAFEKEGMLTDCRACLEDSDSVDFYVKVPSKDKKKVEVSDTVRKSCVTAALENFDRVMKGEAPKAEAEETAETETKPTAKRGRPKKETTETANANGEVATN